MQGRQLRAASCAAGCRAHQSTRTAGQEWGRSATAQSERQHTCRARTRASAVAAAVAIRLGQAALKEKLVRRGRGLRGPAGYKAQGAPACHRHHSGRQATPVVLAQPTCATGRMCSSPRSKPSPRVRERADGAATATQPSCGRAERGAGGSGQVQECEEDSCARTPAFAASTEAEDHSRCPGWPVHWRLQPTRHSQPACSAAITSGGRHCTHPHGSMQAGKLQPPTWMHARRPDTLQPPQPHCNAPAAPR